MNVARVITKNTVVLGLKAGTKDEAISELIATLVSAGHIQDASAALRVVMERERKMSTGLQSGIAIPHGKSESVANLVAAVGIKKEGIPFDSLDGLPATIIILTLSPLNRPGLHIQFLAEIGKALGEASVRENVLTATTEEAVIAAVCPAQRASGN